MKVYTPPETAEYEKLIAYTARQKTKGKILFSKQDIAVYIKLYFKNKTFGDLDNYGKSVLDGLQGVVFENDKQVAKLNIERYVDKNERAEIEIREVG